VTWDNPGDWQGRGEGILGPLMKSRSGQMTEKLAKVEKVIAEALQIKRGQ